MRPSRADACRHTVRILVEIKLKQPALASGRRLTNKPKPNELKMGPKLRKRPEYKFGTAGPEGVRTLVERSVGKTIAKIAFGPVRASDSECHHGEYLVFCFTDGSSLELRNGSNAGHLHGLYRDDYGKPLLASDVSLSFVAVFDE